VPLRKRRMTRTIEQIRAAAIRAAHDFGAPLEPERVGIVFNPPKVK